MTIQKRDSEVYHIIVEYLNENASPLMNEKELTDCINECFEYAMNDIISKYFEVKYVFNQDYTAKYNFRFLPTLNFWKLTKDEKIQHLLRLWKYHELTAKNKEWLICNLHCLCIEFMEQKYKVRFA